MSVGAPAAARGNPRPRLLVPVLTIVVLALVGVGGISGFFVEWWWFREVAFTQVFTGVLATRLLLFVVVGTFVAGTVVGNLHLAYRARPAFRPASPEQQGLERYRASVTPRLRVLLVITGAVLGVATGAAASAGWLTFLAWRNGGSFGSADAQFMRDAGWYVFDLPFYRWVMGFLIAAVLLSLLGSIGMHYLYGGIRLQGPSPRLTRAANTQISVLVGAFLLLKAVAYWLDRYELVLSERKGSIFGGATYTDINAVLPALTILAIVALLTSLVCFANVAIANSALPAIGAVLVFVAAIIIGGVYPAIVEQFTVRPNANVREAPYIERNIAATREAYGIDETNVRVQRYDAKASATQEQLRSDVGTIPNLRLLDPNVLNPTYTQLQQLRNVYGFPNRLDIDRYTVQPPGATEPQYSEQVIAVRELAPTQLTGNQTNWINEHMVYTHGNGVVSAPANLVGSGGAPVFTTGNLPTEGDIEVKQPRIYYGELISQSGYAVVGSEEGEAPREFDQPSDSESDGQVTNTYDGKGGVAISNPVKRLAYAVHFRERNLLLSSAISRTSRILYVRDPRERAEKVAPYLRFDADPYPAVVGGRVVWLLDGYTLSANFPYSTRASFSELTADALNPTGATGQLPEDEINYLRNSVKATVDAYDGTVTLYQFDTTDPLLAAWKRAFPDTIKPNSEIPTDLRAHFRYPEELFKIQRAMLTRYHVTDPQQFFNGQDFWRIPPDPTKETGELQPPYYVLAQVPGQTEATFQLTAALTQQQRDNLAAFMSVSSDPEDYGIIRVLQLPGNTTIPGPRQVQIAFNTTEEISRDLTLFNQQKTSVVFGNMLTLPVGGGLLYVEPLYIEGKTETSYPLMRKVMMMFGNKVAYEDSVTAALDSLFGPGAIAAAPGGGGAGGEAPPGSDVDEAVADISKAITELQKAQQSGDFEGQGRALAELDAATKRYNDLVNAEQSSTERSGV